ncbi:uncharacterized protein [Centruroides vittatus]|uniref:uncharacterized protein isoform X2 n=1 Tax=Centruroides vittatus TaxID=120091 RepID=UPI003510C19F
MELVSRHRVFEASPVFKELLKNCMIFSYTMLTLTENLEKSIHIKKLMTTEDPHITSIENAFELYKLSKKCSMKALRTFCTTYLKNNITASTACTIYDFACEEKDRYIQYYCWIAFDEYCDQILESPDFSRCQRTTIKRFVSRPIYGTLKEITLFRALYKWAAVKLDSIEFRNSSAIDRGRKIRQYLSPFINKIRFLTMNPDELQEVKDLNILFPEELRFIYASMHSGVYLSCLPDTVCSITTKRIKQDDSRLIDYKNRRRLDYPVFYKLVLRENLICRFVPKENCYLLTLILPVSLESSSSGIPVKTTILVGTNTVKDKEMCDCSKIGEIALEEPIYLPKNVEACVICEIDEEQLESIMYRYPLNWDYYLTDLEYKELQLVPRSDVRIKYYINVDVYF